MNYIRHLTGFFERVCKDQRLNPTHISVYMAIFQFWNISRFKNPISISRSEIMELSKVSARNTYHKCVKDLHEYGYFRYDPSYHPLRGSWIYLFEFDTPTGANQYKNESGSAQVLDGQEDSNDAGTDTCNDTGTDTGDVQAENMLAAGTKAQSDFQSPLNISKHNKHIKRNKLFYLQKKEKGDVIKIEKKEASERKGSAVGSKRKELSQHTATKKDFPGTQHKISEENSSGSENIPGIPAGVAEVTRFFLDSGYPEPQALKFFHYNSATGWKVGGKSPIENWQSAAHSWMLNPQNTQMYGSKSRPHKQEPGRNQLHSEPGKDYSEPL